MRGWERQMLCNLLQIKPSAAAVAAPFNGILGWLLDRCKGACTRIARNLQIMIALGSRAPSLGLSSTIHLLPHVCVCVCVCSGL